MQINERQKVFMKWKYFKEVLILITILDTDLPALMLDHLFHCKICYHRKIFRRKGVNVNLKLLHTNLTLTGDVDFEQVNAGYFKSIVIQYS